MVLLVPHRIVFTPNYSFFASSFLSHPLYQPRISAWAIISAFINFSGWRLIPSIPSSCSPVQIHSEFFASLEWNEAAFIFLHCKKKKKETESCRDSKNLNYPTLLGSLITAPLEESGRITAACEDVFLLVKIFICLGGML